MLLLNIEKKWWGFRVSRTGFRQRLHLVTKLLEASLLTFLPQFSVQ